MGGAGQSILISSADSKTQRVNFRVPASSPPMLQFRMKLKLSRWVSSLTHFLLRDFFVKSIIYITFTCLGIQFQRRRVSLLFLILHLNYAHLFTLHACVSSGWNWSHLDGSRLWLIFCWFFRLFCEIIYITFTCFGIQSQRRRMPLFFWFRI